MVECGYCDKDFSSKKERLVHELDEHREDMTGHEEDDKKSSLNKIKQQEKNKRHNRKKKIKYGSLAAIAGALIIGIGAFAAQNLPTSRPTTNESLGLGQPIHWHADYHITVCGEEKVLRNGPMLAHTHGETTFHLEGVRTKKEQATLGWVINQLGVQFNDTSIYGKTSCNGKPAEMVVKVNGNQISNPTEYILRDGDFVRIKLS